MTAKEKVLKVYPNATARGWKNDGEEWKHWIEYAGAILGKTSTFDSEEAAWQNAAESLPAQPGHEPLEWGANCLSAPDRGPHECNGHCGDEHHTCLRCGVWCLCNPCNHGNPRVRSSVTERWVHTDTPIGRVMCIDPPVASLPAQPNCKRVPSSPVCGKAGLWPYPCSGQIELQKDGSMKGTFLCEEHAFQAKPKPVASLPPVEAKEIVKRFAYVPIGGKFYTGPSGTVVFTKVDEDHADPEGYEGKPNLFRLTDRCYMKALIPTQVAEAKPSPDLDAAFEERFMEGQYKTVEYNTAWQAALELDEDDEPAFRAGFDAAWNAATKKAETR